VAGCLCASVAPDYQKLLALVNKQRSIGMWMAWWGLSFSWSSEFRRVFPGRY